MLIDYNIHLALSDEYSKGWVTFRHPFFALYTFRFCEFLFCFNSDVMDDGLYYGRFNKVI